MEAIKYKYHALERADTRLRAAGFNGEEILRLFSLSKVYAKKSKFETESFLIYKLKNKIKTEYGNGDQIWAIAKHGRLSTILIKDSSEPYPISDKVTIREIKLWGR